MDVYSFNEVPLMSSLSGLVNRFEILYHAENFKEEEYWSYVSITH